MNEYKCAGCGVVLPQSKLHESDGEYICGPCWVHGYPADRQSELEL